MNESVINHIKSKHSLETLDTINKLKYFGHIMRISDLLETGRTGRWHQKRKTARKTDRRYRRTKKLNWRDMVTATRKRTQWRDLIRWENDKINKR
jgi:hypothetical protein